jgi:hypothetical protein
VIGSGAPLLNNDGDTIPARDGDTVVLECSYGDGEQAGKFLGRKSYTYHL